MDGNDGDHTVLPAQSSVTNMSLNNRPEKITSTAATDQRSHQIPTDSIIQILARLPVKSLGKFKCVSKEWFRIIADPYFLSLHNEFWSRNPNLLIVRRSFAAKEDMDKVYFEDQTGEIDFSPLKVMNVHFRFHQPYPLWSIKLLPSNGDLICLVTPKGYHICNPSTQVMKLLPKEDIKRYEIFGSAMGYIKNSNEYVFVHLFRKNDSPRTIRMGCEILRVKDGEEDYEWKVVEGAFCPFLADSFGIFVDNVFYWRSSYQSRPVVLISFDLENERFGSVNPPYDLPYIDWRVDAHPHNDVLELGGRLCLVDRFTIPHTLRIWVLDDPKNHTWICQYTIDVSVYPKHLQGDLCLLKVWDEKILIDTRRSLDYYHMETNKIERMSCLTGEEWQWVRFHTTSFFKLGSK